MLFVLKKIISGWICPSAVLLFLMLSGIYATFVKKQKKAGLAIFAAAFALGIFSSFNWIPSLLLRGLERQYPPYVSIDPQPPWVFVLGHGFSGESGIPDSSRIDGGMHARLSEALYIMQKSDDMRLLVSVAGPDDPLVKEKWWVSWCRSVHLPIERTILITEAVDTSSEIKQALTHIRGERFVLVSSAAHMPRAMHMAKKMGGHPVAAPCDFQVLKPQTKYWNFIPSARNMVKLEQALHEYVGMVWYVITRPLIGKTSES